MFAGAITKSQFAAVGPSQNPAVVAPRPVFAGDAVFGFGTAALKNGAMADAQPINLLSGVFVGAVQRSYFDIFYSGFYLIPNAIDFGAVTANAVRQFSLWNAQRASAVVQNVLYDRQQGVVLVGASTPTAFKPLQIRTYSLTALSDGSSILDFPISFFTATGLLQRTYNLQVSGQRAQIAPFSPNWSSGYTEVYDFKTEVIKSRNGKEQRRALRRTPRRRVEFEATLFRNQLTQFNALMTTRHDFTIVFPDLPQQVLLAQPLAASNTVVVLNPIPVWVQEGESIIVRDALRQDQRRVIAVGPTGFTVSPGRFDMLAGAKVNPQLSGRLEPSLSTSHLTSTAAKASIVCAVIAGSSPYRNTPAPTHVLNGFEVVTLRPNWASGIKVEHESSREEVDFDRGLTAVFRPVDWNGRTIKYQFLGLKASKSKEIVDFFHRVRGKLNPFYMPTQEPDLVVKGTALAAQNQIRVAGREFAEDYATSKLYKAIYVRYGTGEVFFANITSISILNDIEGVDSGVNLDRNIPFDIRQSSRAVVSWLPLCRLASDTVTVVWQTTEAADCQISVEELEAIL